MSEDIEEVFDANKRECNASFVDMLMEMEYIEFQVYCVLSLVDVNGKKDGGWKTEGFK